MHYHLAKFCRICIRTGVTLLDCCSEDYDRIAIREKILACSGLNVKKDDFICISCVKKLRISYSFRSMCIKSEDVLNGYITNLLNGDNDEKFINAELRVELKRLPDVTNAVYSFINNNNNENLQKLQEIRTIPPITQIENRIDSIFPHKRFKKKRVSKVERCSLLKRLLSSSKYDKSHKPLKTEKSPGASGLKNLLGFIKGYDFGYEYVQAKETQECSALDKLEDFSKTFFYTDFTDYRNTILSVINEGFECIDGDEMFNPYDEEEDERLWGKVIEPVIKCEPPDPEPEYESELLPYQLVQTCYEEDAAKKEYVDFETYLSRKNGESSQLQPPPPSSLELLQRFTNRPRAYKKEISPNSLKCRTRGQPFINPQLMEQFKRRNFQCETCNRSFKSPGYLHSHCTKMGH